ncbi:MAG: hypothetical protein LUG66_08400, partial [Clostridiales bacterium]|nr:hypothetical protein [Clostridiales bacterium]
MADFENPSRKLIRKRRRLWQRIVLALAMIVVFVTTYMLILPAITLTVATCGFEEHIHSEECYETVYYDGEGNRITAEEAAEIMADEAEEILSGSAVEAEGSSVTSEKILICGLEEHTHTEECYKSSDDENEDEETSGGDGSSSEEEDETSGSALGADTSEGEEAEEADTPSLTDETVSGSALTINILSLLNISLSSGNETDDPVVTITMADTSAADDYGAYIFTNETAAVVLDDNQTTVEFQTYYTFNGSDYILEAEINSGYSGISDILDYVNDYYSGYYSGLYAFTDIYFKEVTVAAYSSKGVEITAGGTETPAYYVYEETGETALLSGLLGSEEALEIKIECALMNTSGVSETEMWMSLVSEDEDGDFHKGELTEVKLLTDYDGSKTGTAGTVYGTEYSVFSSVTDAYDSTVCYITAKIYGGYINDFSIYANSSDEADGKASISDGTSYFDDEDTEAETCTAANGNSYVGGDDTEDSNGVVRTFDTIKYEPRIYFGARGTSSSVSTDGENLVITAEIYKSLAEARFDINVSGVTSNMTWLNYAENFYIEYLYIPRDSSGNAYKNAYGEPIECLLMYEDSVGNKYRSRSDAASGTNTVSVNDLIYGSEGSSGTLSYDSAGDALVYTDSGSYDESNAYKYDVSDTTVFDEEIQAEIEALLINGSIDVNDIGVNCQRLVASIPLQDIPTDSSGKIETITGEGQSQVPLPIGVYVMASKNGDTFRPKLSAYFYNNPDNLSNYNVSEKETGDGYEILSVDTADTSAVNSKTVGTSNDGRTDK